MNDLISHKSDTNNAHSKLSLQERPLSRAEQYRYERTRRKSRSLKDQTTRKRHHHPRMFGCTRKILAKNHDILVPMLNKFTQLEESSWNAL